MYVIFCLQFDSLNDVRQIIDGINIENAYLNSSLDARPLGGDENAKRGVLKHFRKRSLHSLLSKPDHSSSIWPSWPRGESTSILTNGSLIRYVSQTVSRLIIRCKELIVMI